MRFQRRKEWKNFLKLWKTKNASKSNSKAFLSVHWSLLSIKQDSVYSTAISFVSFSFSFYPFSNFLTFYSFTLHIFCQLQKFSRTNSSDLLPCNGCWNTSILISLYRFRCQSSGNGIITWSLFIRSAPFPTKANLLHEAKRKSESEMSSSSFVDWYVKSQFN